MKIKGKVGRGHHLGKKIGFPTINVVVEKKIDHNLSPGVYACKVLVGGEWCKGAMHYGPRPVFDDETISLEVFILDFEGDLYGETVEIEVYNKLREIEYFASLKELADQIGKDVSQVRQMDY